MTYSLSFERIFNLRLGTHSVQISKFTCNPKQKINSCTHNVMCNTVP